MPKPRWEDNIIMDLKVTNVYLGSWLNSIQNKNC